MEFLIGGLAGAGATIFTNPIDVVKTRMQLQGELRARTDQPLRYKSLPHALYVIGRTEGPLALQKGLTPAMLFGLTMNGVRLGLFQVAQVNGWTKNQNGDISTNKAVLWSSVSGGLSALASNPASVIKTRIQAASHPSIAVGRQHVYKGMTDAFVTIYRKEGMRGYFAGVQATASRIAIGSAAQLTTFSKTKEALYNKGFFTESKLALAFAASSISGVAVAFVICPFDVATVRLYNQGSGAGVDRLYTGCIDCIRKVYKAEGLHGLYKGIGPLYLRIAPHTTLSLVMWDMLNSIFMRNKPIVQ